MNDSLTDDQAAHLRNKLVAERKRLTIEIAALNEAGTEKADCSLSDSADAAAFLERRHRATSLRSIHERALLEIDAALERMDKGRYGISEDSGEPIPFERLDVVPWARSGS